MPDARCSSLRATSDARPRLLIPEVGALARYMAHGAWSRVHKIRATDTDCPRYAPPHFAPHTGVVGV
jgi:hypothetical protein